MTKQPVFACEVQLHGQCVAVLMHDASKNNHLIFNPAYMALQPQAHMTFSLAQKRSAQAFEKATYFQQLPPVLSNLLPEGRARRWLAEQLNVDEKDEFALFSCTGQHATGAIVVKPLSQEALPSWIDWQAFQRQEFLQKPSYFALAGTQMKFPASYRDNRYWIGDENAEQWIIKTTSVRFPNLLQNEYTAMRLAEAVGIDIPEIRLVPIEMLVDLPSIPMGKEAQAYAIKRFDRNGGARIHTEDFAQIFNLYAKNKYDRISYEEMGDVLYQYCSDGLEALSQMARRLLVNMLLGNGDAHIKNWSVIYRDGKTPKLSPAYDIVSTLLYAPTQTDIALTMAHEKNWYAINFSHFQSWCESIRAPWHVIHAQLVDVMMKARAIWPDLLAQLPMTTAQKEKLRAHWRKMHVDFCIQ